MGISLLKNQLPPANSLKDSQYYSDKLKNSSALMFGQKWHHLQSQWS